MKHSAFLVYRNVPNYSSYLTTKDYDKFYNWCKMMSDAGHIVIVSEYDMPKEFTCIWQKEIKCMVDKNGSNRTERIEKLWLL